MAVKNRLKSILAEKDIQQSEIAEKLNISKGTLSNIISGNQNATLETALDLAKILNVSVEDILYKEKSKSESYEDFLKLVEQANKLYALYETNKFSRKDIVSIYRALLGTFSQEHDPLVLDLCFEEYNSEEQEEINPVLKKLIYGAE